MLEDPLVTPVSMKQLLEAGVHFGHQTRRWNPKMRRFIFAERSGIYIIDLQKTLRQLTKAQELIKQVILKGENVLFVCTKRQLSGVVEAEAGRSGAMFVTDVQSPRSSWHWWGSCSAGRRTPQRRASRSASRVPSRGRTTTPSRTTRRRRS